MFKCLNTAWKKIVDDAYEAAYVHARNHPEASPVTAREIASVIAERNRTESVQTTHLATLEA